MIRVVTAPIRLNWTGGVGMRYALVLESNLEICNDTASLVASMGYLVTPVYNAKKALHAAHMIQFDLIVTCTATIAGDRRCLIGELARCSPDAILILVSESGTGATENQLDGVNAVVRRPVVEGDLGKAVDDALHKPITYWPPLWLPRERRRRAVD
jgi:CheY-like chemotaxis protein